MLYVLFALLIVAQCLDLGEGFSYDESTSTVTFSPPGYSSTLSLSLDALEEINAAGSSCREASWTAPTYEQTTGSEYTQYLFRSNLTFGSDPGVFEFDYELRVYSQAAQQDWNQDSYELRAGDLKSTLSFTWPAECELNSRIRVNTTLAWDITNEDVAKCAADSITRGGGSTPSYKIERNSNDQITAIDLQACVGLRVEVPNDVYSNSTDDFQGMNVDAPGWGNNDWSRSGSFPLVISFEHRESFTIDPIISGGSASGSSASGISSILF